MYWIGRPAQGQGNGKAAVALALLQAERVQKINCVYARVHPENETSIRLLLSLGFKNSKQLDESMLTMEKSLGPS